MQLRKTSKIICAASDCNKRFDPPAHGVKIYCSDRCKWREAKRKLCKKRAEQGLCPQCGGEMDVAISPHKNKVSASYCKKCQDYYHERYKKYR